MQTPEPMSRDKVAGIVSDAIERAVSYITDEIADERIKAQRYFDGEVDIGYEKGRSKVVATKCRDTVRAIKPALMRVFMASDKPVEFIPTSPDDVQPAEQATAYVQWKFGQCEGYRVLHDAIHDALVKKVGIVKAFYEETEEVEIDEYTGLTDDQIALVVSDPDIEVLEHTQTEAGHDAKVSRTKSGGQIKIESVPPEDFFINSEAASIDDFYVCGHRNPDMRVGDLVEMGYGLEEVLAHAGDYTDAYQDEERFERNNYGLDDAEEEDPSLRKVLVTEAYMKVDVEGAGIPQLYRLICLGTKYHLLDYELADEVPFAVFEVDPEPHTFFGRSLVDLIIEDQDASTSMLRSVLDNVAMVNTPTVDVVDGQVQTEDLLNNEIGAVRRVKSLDAIRWNPLPFTAGSTLPALQYFDETVENKTGVSRASMGLDPDALQNATAAAVNATVSASSAQPELMARHLAEGGMRRLFRLMMMLTRQHADKEAMMRLNGEFIPVDPRSWNADMDLVANVGLGTGGEVEREMILRETLQWQMQIWQGYGPTNGLVTLTQIRNTLADIQKSGGVQNTDRYFLPMNPQFEQMLMQQAQQAQQGQQDPNAALAQAEVSKAQIESQTRLQVESMKAQQKGQTDLLKAQIQAQTANMEDDRKRDEMLQKRILEAAKLLGEYGIQVDQAAIARQQALTS